MEDNENLDGVQTEEQTDGQAEELTVEPTEEVAYPSREQILEGSRRDNKGGDEREKQALIKANSLAMSVGLFIAAIIIMVTTWVKDYFPLEVILIVCGMQTAQSIFVGLHYRKLKKLYLTTGIIECVVFVILFVIWILQLCGVM